MIWKMVLGIAIAIALGFGLNEAGIGFSWLPDSLGMNVSGNEPIIFLGALGGVIGLAFGVIDR